LVGDSTGEVVGLAEGEAVGLTVGEAVGLAVGEAVGLAVGVAVGLAIGAAVGESTGEPVGLGTGGSVGAGPSDNKHWPITHDPGLQHSESLVQASYLAVHPVSGPFGNQNLLQGPTQLASLSEHHPATVGLQFLKSIVQQASPLVGGAGIVGEGVVGVGAGCGGLLGVG